MTEAEEKKPDQPEKAHCPTCNRLQNCDRHGRVYKPWEWSDRQGNSSYGGVTYTLFECRGCETVFYESSSWDDNDVDHWYDADGRTQGEAVRHKSTYPKPPSRPRPDWLDNIGTIDPALSRILDETHKAYEQGCYILAAVGLRTALDNCTAAVSIDPAVSFEEKLKALRDEGFIGETEHGLLDVLTNAGNAAAHRGWSPQQQEIVHLLDVLETFIQRVLVNGKRVLAITDGIPRKPKRQKKSVPQDAAIPEPMAKPKPENG